MYKAIINQTHEFSIADPHQLAWDLATLDKAHFHVLKNNNSYQVSVINADPIEKTFTLKVNGNSYTVKVQDKYDQLVKALGLENLNKHKHNDIKAPMPGLVLSILVHEGQAIKKGEAIMILEAMKMENILKAPIDTTIKSIRVKKGDAVNKSQLLVEFQ